MKITILDAHTVNPGDISWDEIKQLGDIEIFERTEQNQIIQRISQSDIVLTNKVPMSATTIASLPKLKYIGVMATGFDIVDIEAAQAKKIVVTNAPAYSTESVAQMTFSHILNIANHVDNYVLLNRQGRWHQSPDFCYHAIPQRQLSGLVMGIIGFGRIGNRVAHIAHAFGMTVVTCSSKQQSQLPPFVKKVSFSQLLSSADVISLHCPLTPDTRHIISQSAIALMKTSAIIVNTSRGALVNEEDISNALNSGRIAAYCADVLSEEPPRKPNILLQNPSAYITPHIAWATQESRKRLVSILSDNISAFLKGRPINEV